MFWNQFLVNLHFGNVSVEILWWNQVLGNLKDYKVTKFYLQESRTAFCHCKEWQEILQMRAIGSANIFKQGSYFIEGQLFQSWCLRQSCKQHKNVFKSQNFWI